MESVGYFNDRLGQAALQLGLTLNDNALNKLLTYVEQMQRWNRTYNLTAIRDLENMLVQHIFDSLSVIAPLSNLLYKNTAKPNYVLDVGSGAGLPGVVLAVTKPQWQIECLDAVEKKMAFVRQMAGALTLPNLLASHARVETLEPRGANVVISRAFASLLDFANLAGHHVCEQGYLAAMKGQEPADEIDQLHRETQWRVIKVEPLKVPELDARRCLVWMRLEGIV